MAFNTFQHMCIGTHVPMPSRQEVSVSLSPTLVTSRRQKLHESHYYFLSFGRTASWRAPPDPVRACVCSGLADPVYAEAYLTVHQYDIVLDVTVINRTQGTLQNLCLELATMGDLKLVERPQNYTLSPGATKTIRWVHAHAPLSPPPLSLCVCVCLCFCTSHTHTQPHTCARMDAQKGGGGREG